MIVMIPVPFNVKSIDPDDVLTEDEAKDAARLAVWNYLTFTETGMDTKDVVDVYVDGFGECRVRLQEEDE
jgi:hypothetical protein